MIGKRETLLKIKQEMKDNHVCLLMHSLAWMGYCVLMCIFKQIDNYNVTEFNQGHTKRWGFAWSFGKDRVTNHVCLRCSLPCFQLYILIFPSS